MRKGGGIRILTAAVPAACCLQVITDVTALAAGYQEVIDTYKLSWVDFDIEGAALADIISVDRRNKAIKLLQVSM